MRILFWNTHQNKNINQFISYMVRGYNIDIFIAAEYKSNENELEDLFRKMDLRLTPCNTIGCKDIFIWTDFLNEKADIQQPRYSIQIINDKWILCPVHLISDLHGDHSDERLQLMQEIMHDINEADKIVDSHKIIIIGDMNEMPYNKGCLNANAFHGLPSSDDLDKDSRIVFGRSYKKFYNPMWSLMGDFNYPPGTYYYNTSTLNTPMWYMFDQVIISKEVLPFFQKDSLKIITGYGSVNLRDNENHPNKKISDHFPIMCEIKDN